jgi:ribosome-binding protein aMBF1 (putative translation factor)
MAINNKMDAMDPTPKLAKPRGRPRKVQAKRGPGLVFDEGARIRVIRALLGLNMQDFAARLGVGHRTLTNWERYGHTPQPDNRAEIEALCRHSGIAFTSFGYPIPADMIHGTPGQVAQKESA